MVVALNALDISYAAFVTAQTTRMGDHCCSAFLGLQRALEITSSKPIQSPTYPLANLVQVSHFDELVCQICKKEAILQYFAHNEQRFPTIHDKPRNKNRYKSMRSISLQM